MAIKVNNPAHAYLLEAGGDRGVNLARDLARDILCRLGGEDGDRFDHGNAPDDIRVEEEKISIDRVRALVREMVLPPIGSQYKVITLFHAGMMGVAAQNALLKSLEEPPAYIVWILLTDNRSKLLPTVQSRSRLLLPERVLDQIQDRPDILPLVELGLKGRGVEIFINPPSPEFFKQDPREIFDQIFLILNSILHYKIEKKWDGASQGLGKDFLDRLSGLSQIATTQQILDAIKECQRILGLLDVNIHFQTALEHLLLSMSHV